MNINALTPLTRNTARLPATGTNAARDPFLALHRDVNRLFDEAFRDVGFPVMGGAASAGLWPSIELSEGEREIRVTAEVPGMAHDDIELMLDGDALVLRGEKKAENEDGERRMSEPYYGRFERRIPLGFEIGEEQVDARFRNGVLSVTVPKPADAPSSSARRIEISAEG